MKRIVLLSGLLLLGMLCSLCACAYDRQATHKRWPAGASPEEVGKRVAGYTAGHLMGSIDYQNVCCAYGVLMFASVTESDELCKRVEQVYAPYLWGNKKNTRNNYQGAGVVAQWFGFVPFELFAQTGSRDYLLLGREYADEQFANQREDGMPGYTRWWVDDMYGIGLLQGQARRYLDDGEYADRGVHSLLRHAGKLQQANGLFHHTAGNARFFWGRGNGWAAAGMAEMLLSLPKDHPAREQLLTVYRNQMKALVKYQDSGGAWRQLIDYAESWLETSCTGMFVFAMATGVDQGWLPETPYRDVAERGWIALANYVDAQGRLKEVCVGTGGRSSAEKYLGRPRVIGDAHGQGPLLWAATAMIRLDSRKAKGTE
ncbi:MAG: glycoside hydrolase family 88/105 protein [Planctomycetota bacterium]